MSTRATGEDPNPGSDNVALTRSPGFWVIVRYAILFGVVLAFAGLAFLGLVKGGTDLWFTLPEDPGWLDGSLWWVAVTAGAGLIVGVLRRFFRVPLKLAGHGPGAQGPAGRALHGAGGGCRLAGVAGGRGEPRARGRTGEDGGRAGNLGLGAAEAQRGRARDEHAQRDVRGVRGPVVISDPGVDSHARDRAAKGGTLRRHAGRRSAGVLGRVRGVLPDRGVDVRRALRAAVLQVRGLAVARGRSPRPRRRRARADHSRRDRGHDEDSPLRSRSSRSFARSSAESPSGSSASRCR